MPQNEDMVRTELVDGGTGVEAAPDQLDDLEATDAEIKGGGVSPTGGSGDPGDAWLP